jgi:hypothetical protein
MAYCGDKTENKNFNIKFGDKEWFWKKGKRISQDINRFLILALS